MNNHERYKKYIETQCPNCKNKTTDLCEIRIVDTGSEIVTMCAYFEKENEPDKPEKWLWRTAKQKKPLMKL